jgi:hypothetical protein
MNMEPSPGVVPTAHAGATGERSTEVKRPEHRLPFPGAAASARKPLHAFDPNVRFARLARGRGFVGNQTAREHARGRHSG